MVTGRTGQNVPCAFPAYRLIDHEMIRRSVELLLILSTLFLLDVVTTQIILRMGGVELNPLMAGIVANPVLHLSIKAATLLVIIPVSLIAEQRVRGSGAIFYCILILLYIVVVFDNVSFILPRIAM